LTNKSKNFNNHTWKQEFQQSYMKARISTIIHESKNFNNDTWKARISKMVDKRKHRNNDNDVWQQSSQQWVTAIVATMMCDSNCRSHGIFIAVMLSSYLHCSYGTWRQEFNTSIHQQAPQGYWIKASIAAAI
jgi:hypothetical protein